MVIKYDKFGTPYQEPPYTEAERRRVEKMVAATPTAVYRGPRPAPKLADPPAASEPAKKRRVD